ncbi:MAG: proteasome subunit beta [Nitrospirales bacterium]|jgi:proteasome beta subunit
MNSNNPAFPNLTFDSCSSFYQFLTTQRPDLLPMAKLGTQISQQGFSESSLTDRLPPWPHGTTVLAFTYQDGVLIAGDRRATEGFQIAATRMEKVFQTDAFSAMAIAGAAGPCMEMAKLFRIELEHYEKLDGQPLSCEGKANRLGYMVKANFPMVLQGLVVIPLFVGYDQKQGTGRLFKYDITGGRYEDTEFHAVGSGGKDARLTLKEHFRKNLPGEEAVRIAIRALSNAAEEDVGTGGPDLLRRIFPTVKLVDQQGVRDVEEAQLEAVCQELLTQEREA